MGLHQRRAQRYPLLQEEDGDGGPIICRLGDEHAVSLHGVAHKAPMRGVPHGVDSCKLPLEDLRADPADNLSAEAMQAVMEIASVALETLAA